MDEEKQAFADFMTTFRLKFGLHTEAEEALARIEAGVMRDAASAAIAEGGEDDAFLAYSLRPNVESHARALTHALRQVTAQMQNTMPGYGVVAGPPRPADLYNADGTPLTSPQMGEGTLGRAQSDYELELGSVNTDRMNERGSNNANVQTSQFIGNTFHYDQMNGSTGEYGPTQLSDAFQLTEFRFAPRREAGPDVQVVGGERPWDLSVYPNSTWEPGSVFGDFKPDNASGSNTFDNDILSGKLPLNTQMLPYDPWTLTLSPTINPKEAQ